MLVMYKIYKGRDVHCVGGWKNWKDACSSLRINLRLEFSDGVFGILSEFYILNLGSLVPSNLGLMMLRTEGLDQLKIMVYPEYIGYWIIRNNQSLAHSP